MPVTISQIPTSVQYPTCFILLQYKIEKSNPYIWDYSTNCFTTAPIWKTAQQHRITVVLLLWHQTFTGVLPCWGRDGHQEDPHVVMTQIRCYDWQSNTIKRATTPHVSNLKLKMLPSSPGSLSRHWPAFTKGCFQKTLGIRYNTKLELVFSYPLRMKKHRRRRERKQKKK